MYFQACDLLLRELEDRFDQCEVLPHVLAFESLLVKAANGENYDAPLQSVDSSSYAGDLDILKRHLSLLVDVVKELQPTVQ